MNKSLLKRLDGPAVAPFTSVLALPTYRAAIVAAWDNRANKAMTTATLAELTGMRPSHLSDYLSIDAVDRKGKERREMPAKYLPAFEAAVGNSFASQWFAIQAKLTILEAQIAESKAMAE